MKNLEAIRIIVIQIIRLLFSTCTYIAEYLAVILEECLCISEKHVVIIFWIIFSIFLNVEFYCNLETSIFKKEIDPMLLRSKHKF